MRHARIATQSLSLALLTAAAIIASRSPVYAAAGGGQPRQPRQHRQHRQHHPRHQARHTVDYFEGRYLGGVIQHPGSRLTIRWIVERSPATSHTRSTPIILSAALVGPYTSLGALKQAQLRRQERPTVLTVTMHVRGRSHRSFTSILTVPRKTKAGYYKLVLRAITPTQHREIAFVITVKAR